MIYCLSMGKSCLSKQQERRKANEETWFTWNVRTAFGDVPVE